MEKKHLLQVGLSTVYSAERMAELKAEREKMQVLMDEEKYKEVILHADACFGWAEGELEAIMGKPREYTKETAEAAIYILLGADGDV